MNKHLFLLTLSPVQSFISQARKTHDLWAGSRILSELMKHAAELLHNRGGNLIYPANFDGDSLPNRILVAFAAATPEQLAKLGEDVEKHLRGTFEHIAADAFKKACGNREKPPGFDKQIRQHLDIRWLVYPRSADYKKDYAELTALAAAMKNTRTFAQFGGGNGEQGRKCSLDGQRNALVYRPRPDNSTPAYIQTDAISKKHARLQPGEGLSAVSLCKRYYRAEDSFPGTAEVTLMDYIAGLKGKDQTLRALFGKDFDEQLFFEENLTQDYFRKQGLDTNQLATAKTLQKELPKPPTSYYALLAFDGDSMGTWLSGGKGDLDKTRLREFHQVLSEKLAQFAHYAANYLQKPYGKAVYAGGDDFLGFINLAALFPVLKELRNKFKLEVATPLRQQFNLTQELTFSAGVVVAHYKTPLHAVLKYARDAEHAAKQIRDTKDALALRVVKRSGEGNQAILPWYYASTDSATAPPELVEGKGTDSATAPPEPVEGKGTDSATAPPEPVEGGASTGSATDLFMPDELAKVIDDLRDGFSDTFARRLAAQFATHIPVNEREPKYTDKAMFLSELKRLSARAAPDENKKDRVKKLNATMHCLLHASRELYGCLPADDDIKPKALDNFLQALHIAVFLERQAKKGEQ
jgi:CRISPR-associated protein Cmr2